MTSASVDMTQPRKPDLREAHTTLVGGIEMDTGATSNSLSGSEMILDANKEQRIQTWMLRVNIFVHQVESIRNKERVLGNYCLSDILFY